MKTLRKPERNSTQNSEHLSATTLICVMMTERLNSKMNSSYGKRQYLNFAQTLLLILHVKIPRSSRDKRILLELEMLKMIQSRTTIAK